MGKLTAELIAGATRPTAPRISPDGRWVAYLVDGVLWVAAADGATPPGRLGARGGNPRWSPDARRLYRDAERISLATGEIEAVAGDSGDVAECVPLASGEVAVATRAAADHSDPVVWTRPRPGNGLRLPGHARNVLPGRHVLEIARRPDDVLAVLTRAEPDLDPVHPTTELHLVDPDTGHVEHLGRTGLTARSPVWWRGGHGWHLLYLATTGPDLIGGSAVFDVFGGEHRNLTAGMPCCPLELVPAPAGPLALFADGLDTALYRLGDNGFQRVRTITGSVTDLSADDSGAVVAVLASTAYAPPEVHAGPVDGPWRRLSDTRPELRGVTWGRQERLAYRAGEFDLDGLLVLPPGRTRDDGPFSLVTLVHGGPYDRYADSLQLGWFPSGQWLAAAGHAVFLPNARGGRGHGHEFAASVAGAVGRGEWTDVLTGIDLLVEAGVADPDRLGIGGWSHGGFVTAWAVSQTDRFRAALMGAGISDWGMLVATGEEGVLESGLGGGTPWTGPGPHTALSPITHAAGVSTPLLIVHGEADTNVPVSQAIAFHRALRHHGVPHEFVVYPREGHRISERAHQLDLLHRTHACFAALL